MRLGEKIEEREKKRYEKKKKKTGTGERNAYSCRRKSNCRYIFLRAYVKCIKLKAMELCNCITLFLQRKWVFY